MTEDLLIKGFCALLYGGVFAWIVFSRFDSDVGSETENNEKQRYLPYLPGTLLPCYLLGITILSIPYLGFRETMENILPMCFGIFLHISIYYLVLLLLFPLFRKHISSRACAMLWFLPNYLYLTQLHFATVSKPAIIIHLSEAMLWILLSVWFSGFLFVMFRAIWQHLTYRRQILKDAHPTDDPVVRRIWREEIKQARIKKPKFKLVISDKITTPLSIGFFSRSIRVVLPERVYSERELSMILRHEIVHICRGDSENKFFLVFCCAMCWFNPLMWYAMRKSADDLELSCDETVLIDSDEATRKEYAKLLLSTAGEKRGFTTCLSASASALQYRLKNIVKPARKHSGAIVVGVVFFLMFMSSGYAALSYGDHPGYEIIYQADNAADDLGFEITGINTTLFEHNGFVHCRDEKALTHYIGNLRLAQIPGNYSMTEYDKQILLIYNGADNNFALELKDDILTITQLGRDAGDKKHYRILSQVDWGYLEGLLYSHYLQDNDLPFPPRIYINTEGGYYDSTGQVLEYYVSGIPQEPEDWWNGNDELGIIDPSSNTVLLDFSHQVTEEYTVEISGKDGNIIKTYSSGQLEETEGCEVLPLLEENASYALYVPFSDSSSRIVMCFTFTIDYT